MRPPWARASSGAARTGHWCRAASPSKSNAAHRHLHPRWCELEVAMGRGLHGGDQHLAREVTLEATKLLCGDDDDFVTPVHCHVLRPLAADAPYQLAEARL